MEEREGEFQDWRCRVPDELDSIPVPDDRKDEILSESMVIDDVAGKVEEEGGGSSDPMEVSWPAQTGGSIAERRAAKFGFNASTINVSWSRSTTTNHLPSPTAQSLLLTIPAGISPTALLDSPIMLANSQQSPTTGTFPFSPLNNESLMLNSEIPTATDGERDRDVGSSFSFKPCENAASLTWISYPQNQPTVDFEFPAELPKGIATSSSVIDSAEVNSGLHSYHTDLPENQIPEASKQNITDEAEPNLPPEDQKGSYPPPVVMRNSEDGYNWRKYGQKQVKGSEYPRSYYKCTHPNCQVKKKVERSHDGQITEIIYKGAHNHPKPQPTRKTIAGSPFPSNETPEIVDGNGSNIKLEGGNVWTNMQMGCKDNKICSDWRTDCLEITSSTSVVTENSDPLSNTQAKSMGAFESAGTPELSSTLDSHEEEDEDGATQGSISLVDDTNDDESEVKRRKKENCLMETNVSSRAVREPRVIVQIESDIDILDDGYRWRKYGQKVVKGNPNPRSYYKCTSAGCSVRKHVERASHNLKSVITTYEGKHNHEVPAAKNSTHTIPGIGAASPGSLTLPRNGSIPKPETQVPDLGPSFQRKPSLGTEFMRPALLGNFGTDRKLAASSLYQLKFPPLLNSIPYGSFLMNPNHSETNPPSSVNPALPDFPVSLPISIPGPANVTLGGYDFSGRMKPIGHLQPFVGGHQLIDNDMRFLKPKQEQGDNLYDAHLLGSNHANVSAAAPPPSSSSSSSSVLCRAVGNYQS